MLTAFVISATSTHLLINMIWKTSELAHRINLWAGSSCLPVNIGQLKKNKSVNYYKAEITKDAQITHSLSIISNR